MPCPPTYFAVALLVDVPFRQWGVAIFNPAICLLSMCVLPMEEIIQYKVRRLEIAYHLTRHFSAREADARAYTTRRNV